MNVLIDRIVLALALFSFSMLLGVSGFMLIENYSFWDAFYMTVITFSTVGFQEVKSLSSGGRIFTSIYIIINLGIFAYVISVISTYLFEGELRKVLQNFLIGKEVKKFKNHVIVCGFGRNGAKAADILHAEGRNFVIIEKDNEVINGNPNNEKFQFIQGNATTDDVLEQAGIADANTIITALPDDPNNVFITLSAKQLNPNIKVIARASETDNEVKLYRAGANHVIMPDNLGGMHMAQLITRPYVVEFLDIMNGVGNSELILEEVSYDSLKEEFHGKSLRELNIREELGISVIAFKKEGQNFSFNPAPTMKIDEGDIVIVMGKSEKIKEFIKKYTEY